MGRRHTQPKAQWVKTGSLLPLIFSERCRIRCVGYNGCEVPAPMYKEIGYFCG